MTIRKLLAAVMLSLVSIMALAADSWTITKDQRDVEALAEKLLAMPQMQAQREEVFKAWSAHPYAATQTGRRRLQMAINEIMFNGAVAGANSDPRRPKVVWSIAPPIEWHGYRKRGNRVNIDNPDNLYIYIPIEGASSYEITVRNRPPGPVATTFFIWDAFLSEGSKNAVGKNGHFWDQPIDGIRSKDIQKDAGGSFKLTVDDKPVNGRPNHMQSNADARVVFIRESLSDWAKQNPYEITVKRTGGPVVGKLPTMDEMANRAVAVVKGAMALDAWYGVKMANDRPNILEKPWIRSTGASTDMSKRWGFNSQGYFKLAHDEALLVTVDLAGADYLGALLCDPWQISIDPQFSNTSLNNAQAEHNADGTVTYVISGDDPGVKNWLDTGGLSEGYLTFRWIGIPVTVPNAQAEAAVKSIEVVKFADLPKLLPASATRVSPSERLQQYAERTRAVAHHYGLPDK